MELWQSVPEFPNYEVSDWGNIKNITTDRLLRLQINNTGTAYVRLTNKGWHSTRSIALLVANAFLPRHLSEWFDTPINLDGDRRNNHVENLMWRPRWFAIQYHQQFNQPPYSFNVDLHLVDTGEYFKSIREAAIKYGLLERSILLGIGNREGVWPQGYLFSL